MKQEVYNKIDKQENKDAAIVESLLRSHIKNVDTFYYQQTPMLCGVDGVCTATKNGKQYKWLIEIKEANKNYPNLLLKKDKLNSILRSSQGYKVWLIYLSTQEKIAYIYKLHQIDFTKLDCRPMKLKKTQYDDNSPYVYQDVYFIPKDNATYKLKY